MPPKRLVIAVDGPAASGKGTLAARLAKHYGLPYLDTGLLYRAVGKKALAVKQTHKGHGIMLTPYDPSKPDAPDTIAAIAAAESLKAEDTTAPDLGSEEVGKAASFVSAIPGVRAALLDYQRNFAASDKGAVLDGRDIGTVICPDATVKFYVTASPEIRAERRFKQQDLLSYEEILTAIHERDARDSTRAAAPLKIADDATTFDTSAMNADEVFERALHCIRDQVPTV